MTQDTENLAELKPIETASDAVSVAEKPPEPPASKPKSEFDFLIEGQPDFALITVQLPANSTIKAEASVMMSMDANISMKTRIKGGFKRLLSRESLFVNEFTADKMPGEIALASGLPGDIRHYHLDGVKQKTIYLQSSSFLASGMSVEVNTKWQGFVKGFFSGAGLFLVQCTGMGDVYFNSYGGIIEIDVKGEYIIDNSHIVAFTEGLEYKVQKFGGYKSFFLSKEGLVTKFQGQGTVWVQTRKIPAFAAWVFPFRPKKSKS